MTALQRITISFLAIASLTVEIEPLLQLGSELGRVPAWLRQMDVLRQEGKRLDDRRDVLLLVMEARQDVISQLRAQQLTAQQALWCFCQLDSLRAEHGIPNVGQAVGRTQQAQACARLVGWISFERKSHPGAPGDSVLARIEQELQSEAVQMEEASRMD